MSLELDRDLDGYLDAFGDDISVRGFPARGIYRNEPQMTEFGSIRISGNSPLLTMKTSDVEELGIVREDVIRLGLLDFVVKDLQPKGTSKMTVLRLIEAT